MAMKETSPSPALTPFSSCNTLEAFTRNRNGLDYFNLRPEPPLHVALANERADATTKGPAPVDEAPNEILSHVFELGYLSQEQPDDKFRRNISQTSSRFRQVALNTPSLWSKYNLTQGNISQYLPYLSEYLQRSKGFPLDIDLTCFWSREITRHLMVLLLPHSARWRRLSIMTPNSDIFAFLVDVPAPVLEHISVSHFSSQRRLAVDHLAFGGHLPKLSELVLRNVSLDRVNMPLRGLTKLEIRGHGVWPDLERLDELLGGSEALQELIIHVKPGMVVQDLYQGLSQGPLFLPALRQLTVFTSEWLTDDVARLVRAFSAPNLETLLIQERFGYDTPVSTTHILRYSAYPTPSLTATNCNFVLACRCLSPEQLEGLRMLEMHKAGWDSESGTNNLAALRQTFRGMLSLENLVLTELNPYTALHDLGLASRDTGVPPQGGNLLPIEFPSVDPIPVLSLRTLDIDTMRDFDRPPCGELSQFIRLFAFPSLSALLLRRITQVAWEHTLECFAGHTTEYPALTSLTVAGAKSLQNSSTCSPAVAFPNLQQLSMLYVPPSAFLSHLTEKHDDTVPWPNLDSLTIFGDALRARPILHEVIRRREEVSRPIKSLSLDRMFRGNLESWEWIKERVPDTVEI
ncbi:hypothetical protein FA13DRAFT_1740186 [Coprinellus micaceus]|uniref:Uncharacterized protein n=1 Tax=Coprinellus micaceus TaxID=71717 RepID=A0A4Y7SND8_COPMI|nr:hypothetical protein FA13DRAFT_1740186 [Coprinellus micaceus]